MAVAVALVFVAGLLLNTDGLLAIAWASLLGRFGRGAQVAVGALALLGAAVLVFPGREGLPETEAPAAPRRGGKPSSKPVAPRKGGNQPKVPAAKASAAVALAKPPVKRATPAKAKPVRAGTVDG